MLTSRGPVSVSRIRRSNTITIISHSPSRRERRELNEPRPREHRSGKIITLFFKFFFFVGSWQVGLVELGTCTGVHTIEALRVVFLLLLLFYNYLLYFRNKSDCRHRIIQGKGDKKTVTRRLLGLVLVNMKYVLLLLNTWFLYTNGAYSYIVDPGPVVKATKGERSIRIVICLNLCHFKLMCNISGVMTLFVLDTSSRSLNESNLVFPNY